MKSSRLEGNRKNQRIDVAGSEEWSGFSGRFMLESGKQGLAG